MIWIIVQAYLIMLYFKIFLLPVKIILRIKTILKNINKKKFKI